ncbi:DUF3365 domain-containing protein [Singulisphaera sp. GP187]|uniref:DUF3365 domain-containing protein n=1 Tax=Singulisphaera sp. GP187 TaxID=1882752 RepID=UPI0011614A71|nr:DUF3365 domain-containing protein [Singulisphaera sp. GP187]
MSRLPIAHLAARYFKPETALEQTVVADFEKNDWEVSLYLVGREALTWDLSKAEENFDEWMDPRAINGPVLITAATVPKDHPSGRELREFGRDALIKAASGDSFMTTSGRWKIEARPVRADRQSCLNCHTSERATADPTIWEKQGPPLRVGDVLGVVLYLYARNPK